MEGKITSNGGRTSSNALPPVLVRAMKYCYIVIAGDRREHGDLAAGVILSEAKDLLRLPDVESLERLGMTL